MTKTAAIFHGLGGYQERSWVPWQKTFLETKEFEVWTPTLPNSKKLDSLDWWIEDIITNSPHHYYDLVVSHHSGSLLIEKLLSHDNFSAGHIISVVGFVKPSISAQLHPSHANQYHNDPVKNHA